jgi:hypothetical protein
MKQQKSLRPFNIIISDIKWNTGNLPKEVVFYDNYDYCDFPMYMGKTHSLVQCSNIEYHLRNYVKCLFNADAQVIHFDQRKIYVR